MAQVDFHTGVAEPLHFACRLLRKAYRHGVRLVVSAPQPALIELDRLLWTFDEREFVPHLRLGAPGAAGADAWQRTPVWLVPDGTQVPHQPAPEVQVNLGTEIAPELHALARLIEVVGDDATQLQQARARWRAYQAHGHVVVHHPAAA